ncbi:MAG: sulfotransferase [Acidimicrobiia bacterium]|nr:sulfotransferase [Acidimicrobiia bacterium]
MYVFVLGTGRCGSTLVHEVLARHPEVGFVSNVDDRLASLGLLGRWNNAVYRRIPDRFTRKGRLRYAPSEAYRVLDAQVSPLLDQPFRDLTAADATPWLTERFRTFFERRRVAQAKPVFLHKFTGWPRSGFVREALPAAKFVNVIRDGRAVANSWLQMPWWLGYGGPAQWHWGPLPDEYEQVWDSSGRSHVILAGLGWNILMDAFDQARVLVPGTDWVDVRYEDVVAEPRKEIAGLLSFMGLEWTPEFEAAFSTYTFSSGRSDAFRRDLGEADVAALGAALAPHLSAHGYPTT